MSKPETKASLTPPQYSHQTLISAFLGKRQVYGPPNENQTAVDDGMNPDRKKMRLPPNDSANTSIDRKNPQPSSSAHRFHTQSGNANTSQLHDPQSGILKKQDALNLRVASEKDDSDVTLSPTQKSNQDEIMFSHCNTNGSLILQAIPEDKDHVNVNSSSAINAQIRKNDYASNKVGQIAPIRLM
jgi:hypothetical protein